MKLKLYLLTALLLSCFATSTAQRFLESSPAANAWVDSVFATLKPKQKIAQLMVLRQSGIADGKIVFYNEELKKYIKKYKIGSICPFQGNPYEQALNLNELQSLSKIPLLVCIDGENGLGMRMTDSVLKFPDQLTLGATHDPLLIYQIGAAIAAQCKRMGIQVNYAPVVDINNNPANPIIGYRSFGENKKAVAQYGVAIMKGMQDNGIMACAKHFPGHGDVSVDSHLDLPVIHKSLAELQDLEMYPFNHLIWDGVGSVMVAHLSIPAIDSTPNLPTSLSAKAINGELRNYMRFKGISFTDALEMKGVAKFFPAGEASVQSLIAGNDMLCLPGDIKGSIKKIQKAIKDGRLSQTELDQRVRKVLLAKYNLGLSKTPVIDLNNVAQDINKDVLRLRGITAAKALTAVQLRDSAIFAPLSVSKVAYLGLGVDSMTVFGEGLQSAFQSDAYFLDYKATQAYTDSIFQKINGRYDAVIIGLHHYSKRPANNFGLPPQAVNIVNSLAAGNKVLLVAFGNPYAIGNFPQVPNILAAYEEDSVFQHVAALWLQSGFALNGRLPVSIGTRFPAGTGVAAGSSIVTLPVFAGLDEQKLAKIDSIANDGIRRHAFPGCEVLVGRHNMIVYTKTFGYAGYDSVQPVRNNMLYDMASCTKIAVTTISIMKLYEEGKIKMDQPLKQFIPAAIKTDKADLTIADILLHQAGLQSFIPFYKKTIDSLTGIPIPGFYDTVASAKFSVPVTEKMFMNAAAREMMDRTILTSPLGAKGHYVYSDNDFILLGKIIEIISGQNVAAFAKKYFYDPLRMQHTTFQPLDNGFASGDVAPTENEKIFRRQQLRGTVHDPGAAMMGGIAGHAGLFSDTYDLATLFLMLLNGGEWEGKRYLQKSTIDLFTSYHSDSSRRGYGFDKTLRDNATARSPYPARQASPATFGHTGYTGTCIWADPARDLLFIFLSNRVYPDGGTNMLLSHLNIREKMMDAAYDAILD